MADERARHFRRLRRLRNSARRWSVLAGGLGGHDPGDDENPPGPAAVARHAPLLVADLLAVTGRPFAEYLTAAFAEVARTETHD
ncbi:hypothetical protein DLJ57_26800 [Micromonospora chalcea]|nr:hypothetical protein DLJ57_26800 [Micromonospora chalcea]